MPAPVTRRKTGRIAATASAEQRSQTVFQLPLWDQLIKEFLEQKDHVGRSDCTVKYYRCQMNNWRLFLEDKNLTETARDVTPKMIEDWTYWARNTRHLSPKTVRHLVLTLRVFYTWFIRNYAPGNMLNPVDEAEKPKVPERKMDTFTAEQLQAMVKACEQEADFYGIRDKAILILLLDTGLRASELCGIELDDISWDTQSISVIGKGDKERIVPFSEATFVSLRAYLRVRPDLNHDIVFVTHFGNPLNNWRLGDVVERRCEDAKVKGVRCSPHTFRHTFAVQYLMAGGDALSLQAILGHSTLEMTKRYVNFAQTMINTLHRRVSPADAIVPQVGPGRKRIDITGKRKRKP